MRYNDMKCVMQKRISLTISCLSVAYVSFIKTSCTCVLPFYCNEIYFTIFFYILDDDRDIVLYMPCMSGTYAVFIDVSHNIMVKINMLGH